MKIYRCQFCNYNIASDKTIKGVNSPKHKMGLHYETKHKYLIPGNMTGFQFFYFLLTKKDHGSCIICKNNTEFNEITMKYSRFCTNPKCKQIYKADRDKKMIAKYGKLYLTDDPEMQKKMLANRKIGGIYTWSDNKTQLGYVSSYELDFLKLLDLQLKWPASDILSPSPHTYTYKYQNKDHFYIPDFYIPSLNLEIEIKSSIRMERQNPESKEKEILKDELMKSLKTLVNYIKIDDKQYNEFISLIKKDNT